jgi:hypothetical protein
MKRSDFIEGYVRRVKDYRNHPSYHDRFVVSDEGCRDLALNAAERAEEAGVQWDPEEPELPERLTLVIQGSGVVIWPEGRELVYPTWLDLSLVDEGVPLREEEVDRLKEQVARYNALSGVLNGDRPIHPKVVEEILRQEREKLR